MCTRPQASGRRSTSKLAEALDRAQPGQTIALVTLADGVDVLVLRTTAALRSARSTRTLADQVPAGRDD